MTTEALQPATAQAAQQGSGESMRMMRTLGGIALLSGCLLSLVYQGTRERIALNFESRVRNAVFALLPGSTQQKTFEFTGVDETGKETAFKVYAGYDEAGNFIGTAMETSDGDGYGGEIRLLFGYLPDKDQVVGITLLLCKETPGLGDKIKTDDGFKSNFTPLDVPLNPDGSALAVPLSFVKSGKGGGPGQIEGISGATISSKAVFRALCRGTDMMLPVIRRRLAELKEGMT